MTSLKEIKDYSNTNNIYMNFKVEENKIWGLIEGVSKQLNFVTLQQFLKYESFLNESIQHLSKFEKFYDIEASKLLKKFIMYKKRLSAAKEKINTAEDNEKDILSTTIETIKDKDFILSNGEIISYNSTDGIFTIDDEILEKGYLEEIILSELGLYKEPVL